MQKSELIQIIRDAIVSGKIKDAEDAIDEYTKEKSIDFCLKVVGEMKIPIGMTSYKEDSTESQLILLPYLINKRFDLYLKSI